MRIFDARDLGTELRNYRKTRRLTQQQAARLSGVSPRLWSELERGQREQVGLTTALRMMQTVGLDLHTLEREGNLRTQASRAAVPSGRR